jgi:hypothetical protein
MTYPYVCEQLPERLAPSSGGPGAGGCTPTSGRRSGDRFL